ncbi:glycosyltransferase family 9 protein [Hufsiella ginkgonis]|uniref:Uncharacterized protein n=1 Tax=Hufsiella ginkgonis TaxID=2695274 RepID=A0A7K1XY18_9SPHI|nr:glycosyltransferase family 9 protein [Hufsiella ginkgonis]MXV15639.1 hypothetical protein [Hufsiella ginkgonis]
MKPFKKKNKLQKLWLKITDREKYREYKAFLRAGVPAEPPYTLAGNIESIRRSLLNANCLNIKHSGNSGDVMYALPTIRKIYELTGAKMNLYLLPDQPMLLPRGRTHPLGNVMLNRRMIGMLVPLIGAQPYIHSCNVLENQHIDVDLDGFRKAGIPLHQGSIARWCSYVTGITPDIARQWLHVSPDNSFNETIVVARSSRYRNPMIDYSFLSAYGNILFVGVEEEYLDMKKSIPALRWHPVSDFYELASVIAGCRLFIGNQSFPFSIAEALKVPRILEASFEVLNVIPEGGNNHHEFYFQEHFELLVQQLAQQAVTQKWLVAVGI